MQITKEYLGLNTNLAYLGTMWEETLAADTLSRGAGSTVRKVIDGSLYGYRATGMAGVANIGADRQLVRLELRSGQLVCLRPSQPRNPAAVA